MTYPILLQTEWYEPVIYAIGGLTEVGFSLDAQYVLVVSHQGRGIFDCNNACKVMRENSQLNIDDWDENKRTIKGVGPLAGKDIYCVGLWGGSFPDSTADGWKLAISGIDIVKVTSPEGKVVSFLEPLTELRAVGFSQDGNLFVYATNSEILFYVRKI